MGNPCLNLRSTHGESFASGPVSVRRVVN